MNFTTKKTKSSIVEKFDKIYETIVTHIVSKYDATNEQYMLPKYCNPDYKDPFKIDLLPITPHHKEYQMWNGLFGRVSPETYTARVILYSNAKRPLPLFCSKNTFRVKQFIQDLENIFISPKIREELTYHFCKFKQTYWAFTKLAKLWKIRRTPIRIQTDLYMNELDPTHKYTFHLIHKNGIYLFSLQNLARIIVDAITHQCGMFLEPLAIKNPYTNDLLSKCDLFNIYLSLKHNHLRIHEMLEKFFRCEFNVFEFRRKYETELRDIAIEQYANNANTSELAQDVDDMLRLHRMTKSIKIAPGFPQKTLVETMRPLLKIYLLERYSFSSMTRKYSAKKLDILLNKFVENNPIYGRKMTSCIVPPNPFFPTTPCLSESTYVTETTQTNEYCSSMYMNTHVYNEDTFDRYIETGDQIETYLDSTIQPQNHIEESERESTYQSGSPNTIEQINENTSTILARIGRIHQVVFITQQPPSQPPSQAEDQEEDQAEDQEEDEEEDEEEEVIIAEQDNDEISDSDWTNEFDDEEDSVS
jgi:hypothetical protein